MGRTSIQFLPGELLIVGGDYGEILLGGASQDARLAVDQVVAAARHRGDGVVGQLEFNIDDDATPFVESRHAGFEGTIHLPAAGVGTDRSGSEESVAEEAASSGQVEGQ